MEIEQALLAKFQATAGITALVGTSTNARIYYAGRVPQNAICPYIVIQEISALRLHSHNGSSGLVTSRIQISCFDDSYIDVKTLANAVRTAINGFKGLLSTIYVGACIYDNEYDIPDDEATGISGIGTDYKITFNE